MVSSEERCRPAGRQWAYVQDYADAKTAVVREILERIRQADCNCRLVKGQVFLWPGSDDWQDLWDLNGKLDHWVYQENQWIKENA